MKLSDLMRLPNWEGEIYLPNQERSVTLKISDSGNELIFNHNSSTFFIQDQHVTMLPDGAMFIRIRPKNRLVRSLPTSNKIYLMDTGHNIILPDAVDKYLPRTPLQHYYGTAHLRLA